MAAVVQNSFSSYGPDSFAAGKTASVSIPNSHLRQGPGREPTPPASLQPSGGLTHQQLNQSNQNHSHGLPTPSSRSPTLPPVHNLGYGSGVKPVSGDRLGAVTAETDETNRYIGASPQRYYPPSAPLIAGQVAGQPITPSLLAKYYLPDILLERGPLAIRYLTGHLIATVPGFSNIPPAKQRRLVVGALEGRGGSSGTGESSGALAAGGINGDVIFEKVGWGRWDARRKGDPPRDAVPRVPTQTVPGISVLPPGADSASTSPDMRGWGGESGVFQQSEDERSRRSLSPLSSPAEEADKMSMDEDASVSGSESAAEDVDMTDEEDWAKMGAEMLRRQASPVTSDAFSNTGGRVSAVGSPNVQIIYGSWGAGGNSYSQPGHFKHFGHAESYRHSSLSGSSFGYWDNGEKTTKEEQDAIEALVQLSSK